MALKDVYKSYLALSIAIIVFVVTVSFAGFVPLELVELMKPIGPQDFYPQKIVALAYTPYYALSLVQVFLLIVIGVKVYKVYRGRDDSVPDVDTI